MRKRVVHVGDFRLGPMRDMPEPPIHRDKQPHLQKLAVRQQRVSERALRRFGRAQPPIVLHAGRTRSPIPLLQSLGQIRVTPPVGATVGQSLPAEVARLPQRLPQPELFRIRRSPVPTLIGVQRRLNVPVFLFLGLLRRHPATLAPARHPASPCHCPAHPSSLEIRHARRPTRHHRPHGPRGRRQSRRVRLTQAGGRQRGQSPRRRSCPLRGRPAGPPASRRPVRRTGAVRLRP